MGNNKPRSLRFALFAGTGAFFTAVFLSFFSEIVFPKLQMLILSFAFLIIVILTGIIFDVIGVSTTVADEKPFHAKAAKKVKGAGQSLMIIRNADKVASFCSDYVGDICGTVSGALGAAIVFQIVSAAPGLNAYESLLTIAMTGLVAALTVGGKAAGKRTAIEDAETIVYAVGRALAWVEDVIGLRIFPNQRTSREKRR